jgi:phosphoesterase RecJ-like protein
MVIDKKECLRLLQENEEFLVLSHEHPDGDTLGCAFALCEILRLMGKKRAFRCADEITSDFYYMTEGFVNDDVENPFVVCVDVADEGLLGSLAGEFGGKTDLCIDHHMSNTYFAKATYLVDEAAASEIIYDLAKDLPVEMNRYIRNCIYTGISTDTGCFRYMNTTARSFSIVASLMEQGIDSVIINKLMFETKTKSFLTLEMLARETLEYFFDGTCAMITITQDMYKESGSTEHECYPITALPRQIEGVLVGVVIKQKADGSYGISVRTDSGIDASQICSRMGGGGHKGAAGCRSNGTIEEIKAQILDSVKISLEGINQ